MIIIDVAGGLGNQMFQYAAGRALALRHNAALRLDISSYIKDRFQRSFELQRVFAVQAEIASRADIREMLGWQSLGAAKRALRHPRLAGLRRNKLVVEPHFGYWPGLKMSPDDCYLVGYWQSEKYFADHASTIRSDFAFLHPLMGRNETLADVIGRTNSVSLHVRRGDYVTHRKASLVHGTCSPAYYQAAVNYIADRTESPTFFIFSDDVPWVRENLEMAFPCQLVEHNQGEDSFVDMQLMSLCKHHVIANSSFSWWGAWLNTRQEKIVVAPKQWFANGTHVDDLLPRAWVTL